MTKSNLTSSIFLNNVVDNLFSTISSNGYSIGDKTFYSDPFLYTQDYLWNTIQTYTFPEIETPTYPVNDFYMDEDGTAIIKIACTGFGEEDIKIKREDLTLIITAKKQKDDEEEKRKKCFSTKKIGERDFTLKYQCSNKMDFDKLEAKLSKGILSIFIPLKEECKPIIQEFKLKK
jgi:HSP20 family molecular chaperone IbpA